MKDNKQFICYQPDINNNNPGCKTKPKQTKIKQTIKRIQTSTLSKKFVEYYFINIEIL